MEKDDMTTIDHPSKNNLIDQVIKEIIVDHPANGRKLVDEIEEIRNWVM